MTTKERITTNLIWGFRSLRCHNGTTTSPNRHYNIVLLSMPAQWNRIGRSNRRGGTYGPRWQFRWRGLPRWRHIISIITMASVIFTCGGRLRATLSTTGECDVIAGENTSFLGAIWGAWKKDGAMFVVERYRN